MRRTSLASLFAVLFACTGTDPVASPGTPGEDAGGGGGDGSVTADGGGGDASTCAQTQCGAVCVDTSTSDEHCGACGRACGGAGCNAGMCQPKAILTGVDAPSSVTVSGNVVFWLRPGYLEKCPITGCTSAISLTTPGDVTAPVFTSGLKPWGRLLVTDGTNVYYLGKANGPPGNAVNKCAAAGCTAGAPTVMEANGDDIRQIGIDGTHVYWVSKQGGVKKLSLAGLPGSATSIVGSGSDAEFDFAVDGTYLYVTNMLVPGSGGGLYKCAVTGCSGAPNILFAPALHVTLSAGELFASQDAKIVQCGTSGCAGTAKELATGQTGISAIAADTAGVYWTIRGTGTAADGAVRMCALPDCTGGAKTLAANQAAPVSVTVADGFVYWANAGTGTAGTGSIQRVRR